MADETASAPDESDLSVARQLASEVERAGAGRTWRKVTSILDLFGADRLTDDVRRRIGDALREAQLDAKPRMEEVERYETVRLALAEDGTSPTGGGRTRSLSFLMPLMDTVRVSEWAPGRSPEHRNIFSAADGDRQGVLLIDVDVLHTEPGEVYDTIAPLCPGLSREMLEELFKVDALPRVGDAADAADVRFVSAIAATARESGTSGSKAGKAGALVFQLVETLCGPGWLITCWHRSTAYEGVEEVAEGAPYGRDEVLERMGRSWSGAELHTSGDLGTLLLFELARSYPTTARLLHSWLEQWELEFHRELHTTERETLSAIRSLLAEFKTRLIAFELPEQEATLAWFPDLSTDEWARRVRALLTRALADLDALDAALRSSLDLLGVHSAAQQLALAQEQAARTQRLEQTVVIITVLFLAPNLIAEATGSQTFPLKDDWGYFVSIIGLMVLASTLLFLLIRSRSQDRSAPNDGEERGG